MVGVAQLASAPDCGSGDRGFESLHPPFLYSKQAKVCELYTAGTIDGEKQEMLLSASRFLDGPSPSGKAQDFDSCIRQFESDRPR